MKSFNEFINESKQKTWVKSDKERDVIDVTVDPSQYTVVNIYDERKAGTRKLSGKTIKDVVDKMNYEWSLEEYETDPKELLDTMYLGKWENYFVFGKEYPLDRHGRKNG